MQSPIDLLALVSLALFAIFGARSAVEAFRRREPALATRAVKWGASVAVLGSLWFAGRMIELFAFVSEASQGSAVLVSGLSELAVVLCAALVAGVFLIVAGGIARRRAER